jgi:hypothetical protein
MTLAGARRAQEERVLPLLDEASGGESGSGRVWDWGEGVGAGAPAVGPAFPSSPPHAARAVQAKVVFVDGSHLWLVPR